MIAPPPPPLKWKELKVLEKGGGFLFSKSSLATILLESQHTTIDFQCPRSLLNYLCVLKISSFLFTALKIVQFMFRIFLFAIMTM